MKVMKVMKVGKVINVDFSFEGIILSKLRIYLSDLIKPIR